jgi:hypothetical protein
MIKDFLKQIWQWLKDQTSVDEKVKETTDEFITRYNRVKQEVQDIQYEFNDVKESATNVIKQVDDVAKAVGGSKRKGRKPSTTKITKSTLRVMKKAELLKTAKKEFKSDLDSKLTKSNLVNKVYELYHKK